MPSIVRFVAAAGTLDAVPLACAWSDCAAWTDWAGMPNMVRLVAPGFAGRSGSVARGVAAAGGAPPASLALNAGIPSIVRLMGFAGFSGA